MNKATMAQIWNSEFSFAKFFLLCLAGFILGRLFFFPGFFDPFVPSHSDLYRYFSIGQRMWTYQDWLSPRPLMILFLHLVSILRLPSLIWFILSLSSVFFVAALLVVLQRFGGLKPNVVSILLYSIVIFSLPTSFEIYQLDYGGMLAGIISLIAIYVWCRFRRENSTRALSLSLILYWISLEMKPTFAATMLFLALLQLIFQRDKKSLLLVLGVCCVSIFVVLKDRLLGSPFLGAGQGSDIYAVQIDPKKNLGAFWVYISSSVTVELLPGLAIAYYLFWRASKRSWVMIGVIIFSAVSSIMPMILIPNRTLDLYAWYCGMLLCMPFLYIFQNEITGQFDAHAIPPRVAKVLLSVGLLATIVALSISSRLHASVASFYFFINNYNRNAISSLERLRELNSDYDFASSRGILIAGIRGPYNPFQSRPYIQYSTNLPDTYVLLLRESEVSWNNSSHDMGKAIYSNQLDINSFDFFVIYDQDGNISRVLSLEEMKNIPEWQRVSILLCDLSPSMKAWTVSVLENTAGCLDEAGESTAVVELLNNVNQLTLSPVLHYYLGHAYQSLGDISSARIEYQLALAAGENDFFKNALDALPNN